VDTSLNFVNCKPLCPSAFIDQLYSTSDRQIQASIANTFWYRVVNTWHTLPANIVSATYLAMFKARLNDIDLSKFTILF